MKTRDWCRKNAAKGKATFNKPMTKGKRQRDMFELVGKDYNRYPTGDNKQRIIQREAALFRNKIRNDLKEFNIFPVFLTTNE